MAYITKELITTIINENEPFLNEYEFQFALAMSLKETHPEIKVKIEQKIYCDDEQENCRCDIVAYKDTKIIMLAELKYVVTLGAQSDKVSCESRSSFISDIKRLQDLDLNVEKYCIFVSNKKAVYDNNASAKGATNYFNKNYAKAEKWTQTSWRNKEDVRFLVIEPNNEDKIPPEYCY